MKCTRCGATEDIVSESIEGVLCRKCDDLDKGVIGIDEEVKNWNDTFIRAANDIVRLAEIAGTPFNRDDQAKHMNIAVELMKLLESSGLE